jgi:hypothetical protein
VHTDLPAAEDKVKSILKALISVPNFIGALAVDGATFKHDHAIAIMLLSHQLPGPALLCLMYPKHEGPYTAPLFAADLKVVLNEYDLSLTRIACLMGDNVPFNASLAKKLGLQLGKCLAHSLSLVVKAGTKAFPSVLTATATLSGILPAGGSSRHRISLKAVKLSARMMTVYPNRFGSLLPVVDYELENFEVLRKWVATNLAPKTAQAGQGTSYASDNDDGDDDDGDDDARNDEDDADGDAVGDIGAEYATAGGDRKSVV